MMLVSLEIARQLHHNLSAVPKPKALRGTKHEFPYVFMADDAFPLRTTIIKPYSETAVAVNKVIENYRIRSPGRIIENPFGILATRFLVFRGPINAKFAHVESFTKASIALHKYLMKGKNFESSQYCPDCFIDFDSTNRQRHGDWRILIVESETGIHSVSKGLSPLRQNSAIHSRDRQRNLETTSPFLRLIASELSMNGVSRGEFFGAIFAIK